MSSLPYFVIVLDFGYAKATTERTSIEDLGSHVYTHYSKDPNAVILAQSATYEYLRYLQFPMRRLHLINVGQADTNGTKGGGTYHVFQEAHQMICHLRGKAKYEKTIQLVAHQSHVSRALRQGQLFHLQLHPAPDLPTEFHLAADQWWCRGPLLWRIREIVGYLPLKLSHQI